MAELFRSQVRFFGKHGQYLEALTPSNDKAKQRELPDIEKNKYLFDTVVDVYAIAPLVGFLYQRKAERDGGESNKNIMEGALATHYDKLIFSYELLMILDKSSEPDLNERIRRAFQANDELTASGLAVFNDYARGGIEVLYEELIASASSPESLANNLIDFVDDFNDKFIEATSDLDLDAMFNYGLEDI